MQNYDIYKDIAQRSGGDIYIGVVGPVRTGKSTLIKKFMTELVIPNVTDTNAQNIMTDELPQSASGKTVMTTEPKFIPGNAVRVTVGNAEANVRFCDCVGFVAEGAQGFEEDGVPRLINTPWSKAPLPFAEAAALGTHKVISEHSTIAICVTCDGSVADIPREGYVKAEERTVAELKKIGKPFIVALNCKNPQAEAAQMLARQLEEKYGCAVCAVNCEQLEKEELLTLLREALFEFPVLSFDIDIPEWMQVLNKESSAISELLLKVKESSAKIRKMKDCSAFDTMLAGCKYWEEALSVSLSLSTGKASLKAFAKEGVFFEMLSEIAGEEIGGESQLMSYIKGAAEAKRGYCKVKDALECARVNGYGIVQPDDGDMSLESPKLIRQGSTVGIKLKATAPSYHIVKIDVCGEVSPIMGNAAQSEEMVKNMLSGFEANPEDMWDTNLFGKSLRGMVKDGLAGKVTGMQEDIKGKMRRAITRIINEGKGGVICILL